jgi:hypothetical protein
MGWVLAAAGRPARVEVVNVSETRIWTLEVVFTEDADRTRADALLTAGDRQFRGWGNAKRNPVDPDVPKIGEELAAARALSAVSHQLLHAASEAIEAFEGHPVVLHG